MENTTAQDYGKLVLFAQIVTAITQFGYDAIVHSNDRYSAVLEIETDSHSWVIEQLNHTFVKLNILQKDDKRIVWTKTEKFVQLSIWYNL